MKGIDWQKNSLKKSHHCIFMKGLKIFEKKMAKKIVLLALRAHSLYEAPVAKVVFQLAQTAVSR